MINWRTGLLVVTMRVRGIIVLVKWISSNSILSRGSREQKHSQVLQTVETRI